MSIRPEARVSPATPTERLIAGMVIDLLSPGSFDLEADLESIGGNSLFDLQLLLSIEEEFGCQISPPEYLANRNVAALARLVDRQRTEAKSRRIVTIQAGSGGPNLFVAHGLPGTAGYFGAAVPHLGSDLGIHYLQWERPKDEPPSTMESHAAFYVTAMRRIQSSGPYCLAGLSMAGRLAFEIAQQLFAIGEHVAFLAVIDHHAGQPTRHFGIERRGPAGTNTRDHCEYLMNSYVPVAYPGDLWLYRPEILRQLSLWDTDLGWRDLVCGALNRVDVPGDHDTVMSARTIGTWIGRLRKDLIEAWRGAGEAELPRDLAAAQLRRALTVRCRPDVQAATQARRATKQGDLAAEIAAYRAAIACNADQPFWVYRNLGNALAQRGDLPNALEAYRASAAREAVPIWGNMLVGLTLSRLGRGAEADAAFRIAQSHETDAVHVQAALAEMDSRRGRKDLEEARLRGLIERAPNHGSYRFLFACLIAQGRTEDALRAAQEGQEKHSSLFDLRQIAQEMVKRSKPTSSKNGQAA